MTYPIIIHDKVCNIAEFSIQVQHFTLELLIEEFRRERVRREAEFPGADQNHEVWGDVSCAREVWWRVRLLEGISCDGSAFYAMFGSAEMEK